VHTRQRVHGCTRELLPLMVLDIEEISDVLKAEKLFQNGIKNVNDLSRVDHEELSELFEISQDEARKAVQRAKNIVKLVSEFSGDRAQLGILAARTGVKVDAFLDYLLPKEMAERLRY